MRIVCIREGRAGFRIGDILEIPDDTAEFDRVHFARDEGPPQDLVRDFDTELARRYPRHAYPGKQEEA